MGRWKQRYAGSELAAALPAAAASVAELERRIRALERENADLREQRTIFNHHQLKLVGWWRTESPVAAKAAPECQIHVNRQPELSGLLHRDVILPLSNLRQQPDAEADRLKMVGLNRADDHSLNSFDAVAFIQRLQAYRPASKLLVIWDGSPIHRFRAVRAF